MKEIGKFFGNLVNKRKEGQLAERTETRQETSGLEGYKQWAQGLLQQFESKFDPKNPDSAKIEYQTAKRISRILGGSMSEVIHSGGFDKNTSRQKGVVEESRKRGQQFMVTQSEKLIDGINNGLDSVRMHVSPEVLTRQPSEILSIEAGWAEGINPNNMPALQKYINQLLDTIQQGKETLAPLRDVKNADAMLLNEDMAKLSQIYQSLNLDKNLWQALNEDARSNNPDIIHLDALENYDTIWHDIIAKICDEYERAFASDHLSERDKGMAWIAGMLKDKENINVKFDNEVTESVPERFSDAKGYFFELGVNPQELIGKSQAEIQKLLRYKFYDLAKQFHPDLNPGDKEKEERFKQISEAYDVLSNFEQREEYLRY